MIRKIRFIEPGNLPYRKSWKNLYTYNKYIRNPSIGLLTLTTIAKETIDDTLMYSESISAVNWEDILDADIVFIGIFTFSAVRGYEIARFIKSRSKAIVVMGGMHASMNYTEAVDFCDYVLLGEGDESILEFIDAIQNEKPLNFNGIAYKKNGELTYTGKRTPPENIDTIPNRHLLYQYYKMSKHNTLWPQVHASRGCPHNCDYCAVIQHFGRDIRKRTPESVLEDIKQAIAFHESGMIPRLSRVLWLTDDNFFADREWSLSILNAIIDSGIKYSFTIQARYEVGFDDEMLGLLKKAGFIELALGIEFLEDESFEEYHKKCSYDDIVKSIRNIQKYGLNVRGLFIVGADHHGPGIGDRIVDFVLKHNIHGVLIQSMYFVPGTPVYDANKDRLLHQNWSRFNGNVVHFPRDIAPYDLQYEIIHAIDRLYSAKRLIHALRCGTLLNKIMYVGEYFWQKSVKADLIDASKELKALENKASQVC